MHRCRCLAVGLGLLCLGHACEAASPIEAGSATASGESETASESTSYATDSSSANEDTGTTANSTCEGSDLPSPFCHRLMSYGSTFDTPEELVPSILLAIARPNDPVLLARLHGETQLVSAYDLSDVRGSSTDRFMGVYTDRFTGDFNGDGVLDIGVFELIVEEPIRLYDGTDLSLLATSPLPPPPQSSSEAPSGAPAGAIDLDGDGRDEIVSIELRYELQTWTVDSGRFVSLGEHPDVASPCPPLRFVPGDFDGDGARDLVVPANAIQCGDGEDLGQIEFTAKLLHGATPVPADVPTFSQPNQAFSTVAADLDGDGRSDLVVADAVGVALMLSTSDGLSIDQQESWVDLGSSLGSHVPPLAGDMDGDGRDDVILCGFGNGEVACRVFWAGNLEGDTFDFPPYVRTDYLEDLNDDGLAEVIVTIVEPYSGVESSIYWSQPSG